MARRDTGLRTGVDALGLSCVAEHCLSLWFLVHVATGRKHGPGATMCTLLP